MPLSIYISINRTQKQNFFTETLPHTITNHLKHKQHLKNSYITSLSAASDTEINPTSPTEIRYRISPVWCVLCYCFGRLVGAPQQPPWETRASRTFLQSPEVSSWKKTKHTHYYFIIHRISLFSKTFKIATTKKETKTNTKHKRQKVK